MYTQIENQSEIVDIIKNRYPWIARDDVMQALATDIALYYGHKEAQNTTTNTASAPCKQYTRNRQCEVLFGENIVCGKSPCMLSRRT